MIRTLVPLIGRQGLDSTPHLFERIQSLVQDDFGHKLVPIDAGSVLEISNANPLKVRIPFCIEVEGVVEKDLAEDWIQSMRTVFPSLNRVAKRANYLPIVLKEQAVELSLGHVNGSPELIRRAVRLAYEYLSDSSFGVFELAQMLAVSKATLERACLKNNIHGAGNLLAQIKMEEARRMVLETKAPINEIAMSVGYDNLASFDRKFLSAWDCSPNRMRQNAKSVSQNAKLSQDAKKKS